MNFVDHSIVTAKFKPCRQNFSDGIWSAAQDVTTVEDMPNAHPDRPHVGSSSACLGHLSLSTLLFLGRSGITTSPPSILIETTVDRSNPGSSVLFAFDACQLAEFFRMFRPRLLERDFTTPSYWQENEPGLAPLLVKEIGRFRMAMETMDLALALELLDRALAKHPEIKSLV